MVYNQLPFFQRHFILGGQGIFPYILSLATVLTNSTLPLEMLVLMIAKQFPYLADEQKEILHASVLTREEAQTIIRQSVERY